MSEPLEKKRKIQASFLSEKFILLEIAKFLDLSALTVFSSVCSTWRAVANGNSKLWERPIRQRIGAILNKWSPGFDESVSLPDHKGWTWQRLYRDLVRPLELLKKASGIHEEKEKKKKKGEEDEEEEAEFVDPEENWKAADLLPRLGRYLLVLGLSNNRGEMGIGATPRPPLAPFGVSKLFMSAEDEKTLPDLPFEIDEESDEVIIPDKCPHRAKVAKLAEAYKELKSIPPVAQLNLDQLCCTSLYDFSTSPSVPTPLPRTGMLYFFAEIEGGGGAVLYFDAPIADFKGKQPSNGYAIESRDYLVVGKDPEYYDLQTPWREKFVATLPKPAHRIGPPVSPVQGEEELAGEVELFELDSDDSIGWMWGDVGKLYWFIPKESLARCDFTAARFTWSCS